MASRALWSKWSSYYNINRFWKYSCFSITWFYFNLKVFSTLGYCTLEYFFWFVYLCIESNIYFVFSAYANSMKFILIFGVATTLFAIHRSLTYDVTSKLNVQVSNMHCRIVELIISRLLEIIIDFYSGISNKKTNWRIIRCIRKYCFWYKHSI